MITNVQVTFDAGDPDALARFWAEALGYILQPVPEGFESWEDFLRQQGVPEERWNDASAIVDPEGLRPRMYFQRVPEPKAAKNRVHLDLNVSVGMERDAGVRRVREEADRIEGLGATRVREFEQRDEFWIVMQDPEGNEFCLQ
jgi:hypothetical protein